VNQPSSDLASRQPLTKKKLLLVDANAGKRALRVKIMGEAGLDVDCAGDTSAARPLWRANSYHLVLIDLQHDAQGATEFCAEIKTDSPRQTVAFLVGKPGYLSSSPNPELTSEPLPLAGEEEKITMPSASNCSAPPVRGRFLEAVWRMSIAKRSLNDPRPKKTSAQSFGEAVRLVESKNRVGS
jgi:CheY-like chemotaxis protein